MACDNSPAEFFARLEKMVEPLPPTENDFVTQQEFLPLSIRVVLRSEGHVNTENLLLIHAVYETQEMIANWLLEVITSTLGQKGVTDGDMLVDRERIRICFTESASPIDCPVSAHDC